MSFADALRAIDVTERLGASGNQLGHSVTYAALLSIGMSSGKRRVRPPTANVYVDGFNLYYGALKGRPGRRVVTHPARPLCAYGRGCH